MPTQQKEELLRSFVIQTLNIQCFLLNNLISFMKIGQVQNMKLGYKQAKKVKYKMHRELCSNNLHKDYLAMVNPLYNSFDDSS